VRTTCIAVPCSTHVREAPTHVVLERGEGGIAESAVLKCEQIATLPKENILQPLGNPLSPVRMRAVERAVLRAIGILVPLHE
jgi:mRNA-degrading endonuclease toxin of MazEF toxin-antitoxin module